MSHQPHFDEIYLYAKDSFEKKNYQFLIKNIESVRLKYRG